MQTAVSRSQKANSFRWLRKAALWWLLPTAGTMLVSLEVSLVQTHGQTPNYLDSKRSIEERIGVVPGDFEIMVGKSSAEIILHGILKVMP